MTIHAYAAKAAKSPLTRFTYEAHDLAPNEVEIEVSHCGLCHSDLHLIDDAWNISAYPLVPGHEIVGAVSRVGAAVAHLAVGQRVGVGWQRGACLQCAVCLGGQEHLCAQEESMCIEHHGGLADRVRADARFAFPLPEDLPAAAAAPLLCGGITVFSPLLRYGIDATSSVGVIGIGGLGHIAILLLKAFGCKITAFSSSADKEPEARAMGAHEFVCSTDARELRKHTGTLDLLLSTVHVRLDWISYLGALRHGGVLCFLGTFPGLLQIPPGALLMEQKSISASRTGGRATIRELLTFAARHRIQPEVQILPMEEINTAIDLLRRNQARYRIVLER
jgi:alcohol/geraniol dehydrogenase (NADP+)